MNERRSRVDAGGDKCPSPSRAGAEGESLWCSRASPIRLIIAPTGESGDAKLELLLLRPSTAVLPPGAPGLEASERLRE